MTSFSIKQFKYVIATATIASIVGIGVLYPNMAFPAFLVGWLVLIPVMVAGYVMKGLKEYMKDRNNRIEVSIKNNDITTRYAELIRKEEEIKRAKEALYKELIKVKR